MRKSIFEEKLTGGHPNSLGNTVKVVEEVLSETEKLEELYLCYFLDDEVVRLRTSNAWKRVARSDINLFVPFIDCFIKEISKIDQASTKWTLANLFEYSEQLLTGKQKEEAIKVLKKNLKNESDWIVLKNTATTLGTWAQNDKKLKKWLKPHLKKLSKDPRKAVSGASKKIITQLEESA